MFMKWLRLSGLLLAWVFAFRASLSIVKWHGDWGHGICGPWGCGPPLQALVGCHAAWLVFLLPLALMATNSLTPKRRIFVGRLVVLFAVSGLIGVVAYEYSSLQRASAEWGRNYFWPRVGFAVITFVDLPLLELLLAGLIMTIRLPRFRTQDVADRGLFTVPQVRTSDVVDFFDRGNQLKN